MKIHFGVQVDATDGKLRTIVSVDGELFDIHEWDADVNDKYALYELEMQLRHRSEVDEEVDQMLATGGLLQ